MVFVVCNTKDQTRLKTTVSATVIYMRCYIDI